MIGYDVIAQTIVGSVCVAASDAGLCAVIIAAQADSHPRRLRSMFPGKTVIHAPDRVAEYRLEMEQYFAGERTEFSGPFDFAAVNGEFHRKVLAHLATVPYGSMLTYGELAVAVGAPDGARAVGVAMATNPLPIIIPCHRVVAANSLGGYSGGGIANKRALLVHEGASPPELF